MGSSIHPAPNHKYRIPIRDRSRHGSERLFDAGSRAGWSGPVHSSKLWLLPLIVAVGVAVAYLSATGGSIGSQLCDALREMKIEGPKTCTNVVWVRAKSRETTRPIVTSKARSRNRRG